jgi:hypothetical protein
MTQEQLAAEVQQVLQPPGGALPGRHSGTSRPAHASRHSSNSVAAATPQLLQLAGIHCCAAPGGLGDAAHQVGVWRAAALVSMG